MWKSVIRDYPEELDESGTEVNPLFFEWVEALVREPWLVALQDLVAWTKIWTGTEEELMEEIRFRVNREVCESEDFPSDFPEFREYYRIAWQEAHLLSRAGLRLELFVYDEFTKEDLKEFYAPGWGPAAPILVERDQAARHSYWFAMYKLVKYEEPLLMAFLIFTESTKFARGERRWSGSTDELVDVLTTCYPSPGLNCGIELAYVPWINPEGTPDNKPMVFYYHSSSELLEGCRQTSASHYRRFNARMKTCAGILEEVGIKVSKKKETRMVREPGGGVKMTKHTRWIVEAPPWRPWRRPRRLPAEGALALPPSEG